MPSENKSKKILYYFDPEIAEVFTVTHQKEGQKEKAHRIVTRSDNVFLPGEVVARIIDEKDPRFFDEKFNSEYLKSDFVQTNTKNVVFNQRTGEFVSSIYGFAKLVNRRQIIVEPMIVYSTDKMKAWVYICMSASRSWPKVEDIRGVISSENIAFSLENSQIRPILEKILEKGKTNARLKVAEGTPPVPGAPEMVQLKKEMTLKIGKVDETGRIDYKEKDSFISVNEGEVIAKVIPAKEPEFGVDVFGKEIPAKVEGVNPYRLGPNVSKDKENPSEVIAEIDGVLEIDEEGRISVENKVTIDGNVNLETGNIHFPGAVEIKGSVEPGFLVEADGNVLIHDNVEDATIKAGGNVIIQNGAIGKERVRITADGSVKCKFSQNAHIRSGGDLFIMESAIQTKVFAKNSVQIKGAVLGGDIIARHYLDIESAGSSSGVKTHLTAGRDPEIESQVEDLSKKHSDYSKRLKEIIDELTQFFGENFIKKIKDILPTLPKHRKASALKLIKEMSEVNSEVTRTKAEREKLKNMLFFDEAPYIKVNHEVYPEVYIRVIHSVKKVEKKIVGPATFKEDPSQKVIYWD